MRFFSCAGGSRQSATRALAALGLLLLALIPSRASAAAGMPLPAASGTEWRVLSGYNTATHSQADGNDPYAVDIERVDGLTDGTAVLAPLTGAVRFVSSSCVTIRDAAGTSLLLCHIFAPSSLRNTTVYRGQQIGTVAPPGAAGNNGVAHIHLALSGAGGVPIPFAANYALEGTELPATGEPDAYAGMTFRSSIRLAPVVDAGADQTVRPGSTVVLSPNVTNPAGGALILQWTQFAGPTVTVTSPGGSTATFTAPLTPTTLQFRFSAIDTVSQETFSDTVTVRVSSTAAASVPAPAASKILSGLIPQGGGLGLIVFAGGSSADLLIASGCPRASAVFWTTADGAFLVYVPASTVAVVNRPWEALFPAGIPAGTALLGRCR